MRKQSKVGIVCVKCGEKEALPDTNPPVCGRCREKLAKTASTKEKRLGELEASD